VNGQEVLMVVRDGVLSPFDGVAVEVQEQPKFRQDVRFFRMKPVRKLRKNQVLPQRYSKLIELPNGRNMIVRAKQWNREGAKKYDYAKADVIRIEDPDVAQAFSILCLTRFDEVTEDDYEKFIEAKRRIQNPEEDE